MARRSAKQTIIPTTSAFWALASAPPILFTTVSLSPLTGKIALTNWYNSPKEREQECLLVTRATRQLYRFLVCNRGDVTSRQPAVRNVTSLWHQPYRSFRAPDPERWRQSRASEAANPWAKGERIDGAKCDEKRAKKTQGPAQYRSRGETSATSQQTKKKSPPSILFAHCVRTQNANNKSYWQRSHSHS